MLKILMAALTALIFCVGPAYAEDNFSARAEKLLAASAANVKAAEEAVNANWKAADDAMYRVAWAKDDLEFFILAEEVYGTEEAMEDVEKAQEAVKAAEAYVQVTETVLNQSRAALSEARNLYQQIDWRYGWQAR